MSDIKVTLVRADVREEQAGTTRTVGEGTKAWELSLIHI